MFRWMVAVMWVCVTATAPTHAIRLRSRLPFHPWVDQETVLVDLSPAEHELTSESFLELVTGTEHSIGDPDDPRNMQFALLDADPVSPPDDERVKGKKGCDGSYNCADFKEADETQAYKGNVQYYKPQQASPETLFPIGTIPRQAHCYVTCDYQSLYSFRGPLNPDVGTSGTSRNHAKTASLAKLKMQATSFLEEQTEMTPEDNGQLGDQMSTEFLASPFHCKTHCDFTEPRMCNPVRRMLVGSTGYTPQEHSCCGRCEAVCKGKTVLDRYRMCAEGCRSFCPFVDAEKFSALYSVD